MSYKPVDHNAVSPYLMVADARAMLGFLVATFEATELDRRTASDGAIKHAEVRIDDSVVMLGERPAATHAAASSNHVYVADVDACYRRALAAGAQSVVEPRDQSYGDRSAGIRDPEGNIWWLGTHLGWPARVVGAEAEIWKMAALTPPRIRPLERTDAPAYRALRATALAECPTAFSASPDEEASRTLAEIAERIAPTTDNGVVTLGAFDGEDLCGFTAIIRPGKRKLRHGVELAGLYVAPARRHRGIGRALLRAAADRARSMDGVRQIKLGVTAGNHAAIAAYRALGFERYALEPDALAIDGELHALELLWLHW